MLGTLALNVLAPSVPFVDSWMGEQRHPLFPDQLLWRQVSISIFFRLVNLGVLLSW